MRPEAITETLGIQPWCTDFGYVNHCAKGRKEECGLWSYDSAASVSSGDITDHLEHLLRLFRPLKSRLEEIRPPPRVFVHLRCAPQSAMQPLWVPRIEAALVAGLAELGAVLDVELLP